MNYPVWSLDMGGGVLMAIVAVLHVFVAHFAVGGGLWLVVTERRANRRGDRQLRDFVKSNSRFFLLLTLVFGAITGVGIWSTAALISPHGILALIHGYVWGWAMEWTFFVLEIAAALVYWYGWDRLDDRTHEIVGWIYFVGAFMSLVIINGIVTFMLTPGGWLQDHAFWTGFFNPTYWPSLATRTFVSMAQAGLFTLLVAAFLPRHPARRRAIRWCGGWVAAGMLLTALSTFWYDHALASALPDWHDLTTGAIPVLPRVISLLRWGLVGTFVLSLWPLLAPRSWNPLGAVLLFAGGLAVFYGGEWTREAARKPYVIHGYMYSTGLLVSQTDELEQVGAGALTRWRDPAAATPRERGRDLYRAWCQPCHTMDGYNGLRPYLAHWSPEQIAAFLPKLQYMRAQMPPWYGSDEDIADLTAYLAAEGSTGRASYPLDPEEAGALAFRLHCGLCHTTDGYRSLRDALAGSSREDLEDTIDELTDLAEEMAPFLGSRLQRKHLLDYLETLAATAADEEGGTR